MNPRLVEVILSSELRGKGTESDPYRTVYVVWTKDGGRLAERDTSIHDGHPWVEYKP